MRLNKNYYDIKNQWHIFGASKDWDTYIASRNKHETNPVNVMALLGDIKGIRIVEFGCGDGSLTEHLLKAGAFVHGVDFAQSLLGRANKRLLGKNRFALSPIIRDFSILTDLDFKIVLAVSMLEHLPEDMTERIFQDARRVLKKGGHFIFRLPLDKEHRVVKNEAIPALDTVFWTTDEIEKLAVKYKYEVVKIGFYSIFQKVTEL